MTFERNRETTERINRLAEQFYEDVKVALGDFCADTTMMWPDAFGFKNTTSDNFGETVHQSRAHPANLGGERTTLSLGAALKRQPIFNILEGVATGPNHNSRQCN